MKTFYKIITCPPYDKDASNTYWIKKETIRFRFFKSSNIIGDYRFDDTYGELGECPFFNKKAAKKRIKQLI